MANTDEQNEESQIPSRHSKQSPARRRIALFFKILLGIILFVVVTAAGIAIGFVTANINARPDMAGEIIPPASSQIYDFAGNEIANIHAAENRMPVKIEQIPLDLQQAFISIEDNRFYEHKGVDPRGLLRAAYKNLVSKEIAEGGSTITQQLAKNAYLTQERTMKRKIQEVFLALQLEKQYTKQEILEMYLNQIYFGQGAYGVQAASKVYFGKNVENLNLSECAMLAGIPKSPNYYSPFNNLQEALTRRNVVLEQMVKYHYINRDEADTAKNTELIFAPLNNPEEQKDAQYFIDYVTKLMVEKYGADAIYKDGLKIYTTIDMDIQRIANAATAENIYPSYTDANGIEQPQYALVAIEPTTGYIKAMVGGRGTDQFNRATMAERQPGSAFKPFVFATALENSFTPDTVIEDKPITIGDWSPKNDSGRFSGSVSMRTVATFSMNVPTVRIARELGMEQIIYYAQLMGINTFVLDGDTNDRNLATSLGGLTRGVTPLEITSAYCTFANNGIHMPSIAITKVLDRNGNILEEAVLEGVAAIRQESAAGLTSMLEDVIATGTGKRAAIGRPAAGKTGTTSDYKDAWFVGYTPDLAAAVWIGNDDGTPTDGLMGGYLPAATWSSFMSSALANVPAHDFSQMVIDQRRPAAPPVKEIRDETPAPRYEEPPVYEEPRYEEPRYEEEPRYYEEPSYYEEPRYDEPTYKNYDYDDEPRYDDRFNYNDEPFDNPSYEEDYREPESYSEPEPYYEPEPYSEPEPYDEPESYSEPEPYYEPEPAGYDDTPSPGDDISKDY